MGCKCFGGNFGKPLPSLAVCMSLQQGVEQWRAHTTAQASMLVRFPCRPAPLHRVEFKCAAVYCYQDCTNAAISSAKSCSCRACDPRANLRTTSYSNSARGGGSEQRYRRMSQLISIVLLMPLAQKSYREQKRAAPVPGLVQQPLPLQASKRPQAAQRQHAGACAQAGEHVVRSAVALRGTVGRAAVPPAVPAAAHAHLQQ